MPLAPAHTPKTVETTPSIPFAPGSRRWTAPRASHHSTSRTASTNRRSTTRCFAAEFDDAARDHRFIQFIMI